MPIHHGAFSLLALVGAAVLAAAPAVRAAPITWGLAQNISGDGDVSLTGTLVGAVNLDGPAASVNGVNFQALDISAGPATVGNFTVNGFFFNQFNPGFSTASASPPFSGLSAGYRSMLGTGAATAGTMTLTMAGLTVGQNYEFQAWVNDSRNQTPPGFTFTVDVSDGVNTVTLDPNPSLAEGGLGQYVIGTFTANSVSQQVTFDNSEVAVINGFQLREISSPGPNPVPLPPAVWAGIVVGGGIFGRRLFRRA